MKSNCQAATRSKSYRELEQQFYQAGKHRFELLHSNL